MTKKKGCKQILAKANPAGNYMFKVNNKNTRTRSEICSHVPLASF